MNIRNMIITFFLGVFALVTLQVACASNHFTPPAKVSMVNLLKKLEAKDSYSINIIEYANGVYNAEGLDKDGNKVKAELHPGAKGFPKNLPFAKIPAENKVPVSMYKATKIAIANGYKDIRIIKTDKAGWEMIVFQGHSEIEVTVDKNTGKFAKEMF